MHPVCNHADSQRFWFLYNFSKSFFSLSSNQIRPFFLFLTSCSLRRFTPGDHHHLCPDESGRPCHIPCLPSPLSTATPSTSRVTGPINAPPLLEGWGRPKQWQRHNLGQRQLQCQCHVIRHHQWSNATSAKRRERRSGAARGGRSEATRGCKIPTAGLANALVHCLPTNTAQHASNRSACYAVPLWNSLWHGEEGMKQHRAARSRLPCSLYGPGTLPACQRIDGGGRYEAYMPSPASSLTETPILRREKVNNSFLTPSLMIFMFLNGSYWVAADESCML